MTRRITRELPLACLLILAVASVAVHEASRPAFKRFSGARHRVARREPSPVVPAYFRDWRERFLVAVEPHDPHGLVRGIFLGDDSATTPEARSTFREAGLSHLLAASGFNCLIVALAFSGSARAILALARPLLSGRASLLTRSLATPVSRLAGAWVFWAWSDQSPPITRAAVMVSALLALEAASLSVSFARLLAALYLGSLVLAPGLWRNASFQLTYGCLFGLLWLPVLLEPLRPRRGGAPKDALWNYLATSLGATLGTIPTTWLVFGEANFTSILTNWFAVPPVSALLMPLALSRMLLAAPGPGLDDGMVGAAVAGALSRAAALVAQGLLVALGFWLEWAPALRL